jgi:hypothetical protein
VNRYRSTGLQFEISVWHSCQSIKKGKSFAHVQFLLNNGIHAGLFILCCKITSVVRRSEPLMSRVTVETIPFEPVVG